MFYAFTPEGRDSEGFVTGGEYLGSDPDINTLRARLCNKQAVFTEGPAIHATSRGTSNGYQARLTYDPLRQTFGLVNWCGILAPGACSLVELRLTRSLVKPLQCSA